VTGVPRMCERPTDDDAELAELAERILCEFRGFCV
jgi:hypothetical protein